MDTSSTRANAKEERSKTMDGEKSIAIDNDETTTRRRLHTVGVACNIASVYIYIYIYIYIYTQEGLFKKTHFV